MIFHELTLLAVVLRILLAIVMGGIIGMERGLNNHSAGMRTYMLVCVGSCLIMMTDLYIFSSIGSGDPTRMGAQVVSGIGFLGAGTIMVTRHNQIRGLTTAAGLWAAAGIGLALGVGFYEAAVLGTLAIFIILTILHRWDESMLKNAKVLTVYVELSLDTALSTFLHNLRKMDINFSDIQMEQGQTIDEDVRAFIITLKGKQRIKHSSLLSDIRKTEGVIYMEELS